MKTFISSITGKEFPRNECVKGSSIRRSLFTFIQKKHPEFNSNSALSISELNHFREKYISEYMLQEVGELNTLEADVVTSLQENSLLTEKLDTDGTFELSIGQKLADAVASFGGSWAFIICFILFMLLWIITNIYWLKNNAFDPFPFILLNLILSCIAALQAPIIMMSQNRQEEKDRERARKDYMINLKSELEIRVLHEKIDHLIMNQQQELLEIQKVQIDMMQDIISRIDKRS